jgi:four helix bundle protein
MNAKTYKDLTVWQKSMTLAKQVYALTSLLPSEEKFGIASQLQRAAVSIPSNMPRVNKEIILKNIGNL